MIEFNDDDFKFIEWPDFAELTGVKALGENLTHSLMESSGITRAISGMVTDRWKVMFADVAVSLLPPMPEMMTFKYVDTLSDVLAQVTLPEVPATDETPRRLTPAEINVLVAVVWVVWFLVILDLFAVAERTGQETPMWVVGCIGVPYSAMALNRAVQRAVQRVR